METSEILIPRRRLMGLILCTGTGLLMGAGKADAMWNVMEVLRGLDQDGTPSHSELPPSLRGVIGPKGDAYRRFLSRIGLKRISVQDIMDTHAKARGNVHNTLPPKPLWNNIRSTLIAMDKVAGRLGERSSEVLSVYRSPAYNALCPGAKSNSYHIRNNAIDIRFNSSPKRVAAVARDMRREGLFKGGVGRYPGFTHLDTRGSNADW